MPPVNQPRTLCSLVADALCEYIYMMVSKGTDLTESTDDVLQGAEEELEKLIMYERNSRQLPQPFMRNTYKAALHLKNVQTMLEKHGSVPNILNKSLSGLPASFLNDLINKMLVSVSKIIVYDEDQIEKFLNDQWSFGPRLKVGLHVILKSMLSLKISSLDFSPISNPFCKVLARYFMKAEHKNNHSINDIEKKKDELFTATIFSYKDYIVSVTNLSLQNLASARLVWAICYCCPNLWHLDISGNLFDMDRYCALERAPRKPESRNRAEDRWFDKYCAEFIQALSGIYGSHGYHTNSFEEVPHSLRKLRTLRLPDVEWTDAESFMLDDHGSLILQYCVDLQEITGVNLYFIFMNFGCVETLPLIMKLRKFHGKDYKGGSLSVPRDVFRKVRLPCITEVIIVMTLSVGPWILKEFPNMKHLKVTPLYSDISTYSCSKILPYLTNLCFLDITFKQEISLSDMCEIADSCKHLQSFKLKCLGLLVDGVSVNGDSGSYVALKNEKSQSDFLKKDVDSSGSQKSHPVQWSFQEYIQSWVKTSPAPYEQDNKQIPKFSRLQTLEISEVKNTDVVAMYKCIKGSPKLRTFSFVALEGGDDRIKGINDDFVGRVCPLFKCLKELTLGAEDKKGCKVSLLKNLTCAAVEHIVNLCMNIQSIGNVACWNVSSREVKSINKRFKKCNYILRLC